jgi:diguanylate cyclase (GGDEF)-like protein/putative nucleotidyltransferase with HDIG domain
VPNPDGGRFSVLLVESDPDAIHFVRKSLETNRLFSFQVDHAFNIGEALHKIERNSYHLLMAESELEEETGLSLFEKIAEKQLNIPFVLMLPIQDDNIVRQAMKIGITDIIIKNQSHFQELSEKLHQFYQKFHESRVAQGRTDREEITQTLGIPEISTTEDPAKLTIRDQLTGLYSHGHLHERVVREFSQASRYGYPLSCLLIDIDMFKGVNEEHGYAAGEELIKEAAALLFDNCRLSDFVARYGGEEFCVLLPHINYEGAQELANRLNKLFSEKVFLADKSAIHVTVSIGVSSYPEDTMSARGDLINFASQAIFRSKISGRDKVTLYRDIVPINEADLGTLKIGEDRISEFQERLVDISKSARRSYIEASKALILTLESKDRFTVGHSASTAKYCLAVAQAMGLSSDDCETIQQAGLLHDVGKICIPDSILLKPGRLTLVEFETMKQHAYLGYKMLKPIKFLQQEAVLVLHHHEWFNGEGYPCKLKGNEIPLGSRIISVVDSYDTIRLAGGRYKKTSTVEDTVNELIACSGKQFDPEVVKVFIQVLKTRGELTNDNYNADKLEEIIKAAASSA